MRELRLVTTDAGIGNLRTAFGGAPKLAVPEILKWVRWERRALGNGMLIPGSM
jgi:hypothetical protein